MWTWFGISDDHPLSSYAKFMVVYTFVSFSMMLAILAVAIYVYPKMVRSHEKHEELIKRIGGEEEEPGLLCQMEELIDLIKEWGNVGREVHEDAKNVLQHARKEGVEPESSDKLKKVILEKTNQLKEAVEQIPKRVMEEIKTDGNHKGESHAT